MKNCELCNELARIYCESDHADLCWDCDLKVHSANFLVAKHSRTLLCNVCQSPTAWSAGGVKIGRTVSVCEKCVNGEGNNREEEEEEIDLEDFQVVPWSSTSPPPPATLSSSDQSLTEIFSLKRMREDDDSGTSTSHREASTPPVAEEHGSDEAAEFVDSMRMPLKIQRTEEILPGRVDEHCGLSKDLRAVDL